MHPFLIRLECRSPYLTPWRSCTLWGRVCWIIASGGVPGWSIRDWIDLCREGLPPLVMSDGLAEGAVPVPAAFLALAKGPKKAPKALPWSLWLGLCQTGKWPEAQPPPTNGREATRQHVVINRATGTALEGQLRTEKGTWPEGDVLIVALADDSLGRQGLESVLAVLCTEGWGYGRSYGYGQIVLKSIEPLEWPAATGAVATLGHCHPADGFPPDGYWRWSGVPVRRHDPETRRGPREEFTAMLAPGASFAWEPAPRTVGRIVFEPLAGGDHFAHCGLAPAWPIKMPEEKHG